ncbi:DUF402 domain-containing protein [Paenibacillus ginsengarvi]|uniref:DUF402 domain-containing protein n=1 Tax=Paenibacillus ginsengarvi TaxID=400777 RepID=A0A3B0CII5_9BACL|nr:DUF402 domain-containing protein [Paenibacillus ginsengarvi]RKN84107.1 DUF402 domain-containing protein [Paenibacillus ginsengarvi]
MIRQYADRTEWGRIARKQFTVVPVKTIGFSGTVTLVELQKVNEPLYSVYETERICIADDGYKWLQLFPEYAHYTVTAMYDDTNRSVQRVISICKCQGVTESGVPWYEDLYLSLVVLPGGELYVMYQERLEEAVRSGQLTQADADLAWETANHVMDEYRTGSFDLLLVADKHLQELIDE